MSTRTIFDPWKLQNVSKFQNWWHRNLNCRLGPIFNMLLLNFSGFLWQPSNDMKCQPVKISLLTVNSLFKTWKNFINSFLCSTTNFAVSCYDFNSPRILASSFNCHSRWKQNKLQLFMRSLLIFILWNINVCKLQLKSLFLAWKSTVSSESILISAAMKSWNGIIVHSVSILKIEWRCQI